MVGASVGNIFTAALNASAAGSGNSGDNAVVAAVAGYSIRILSVFGIASAALNLTVKSDVGNSSVALTAVMPLSTNGQYNPFACEAGVYETAAGKALNFNISAGTFVGHLTYQLIPFGG